MRSGKIRTRAEVPTTQTPTIGLCSPLTRHGVPALETTPPLLPAPRTAGVAVTP
jgi:hypothetical protein